MRLASIFALSFVSILAPEATALAHPGGLNSEGCHNNRKTGDYHCHRGGSSTVARLASSAGVSFRNCSEARAAGVAPIRRGEPGYADHLDRDGDGIACEPYRGR